MQALSSRLSRAPSQHRCAHSGVVKAPTVLLRRPLRYVQASSVSTAVTELEQLTQENFYEYLEEHSKDRLVVVDFYTDWCGPCKVIYPELVKLANERSDIRIVKFNCNKANKELGVKLGIKVAPTFHLYRNSEKVAEMTGAKIDNLKALIDKACQPSA